MAPSLRGAKGASALKVGMVPKGEGEGGHSQVLPYHLNDPRIDKAARQAIPFLRA